MDHMTVGFALTGSYCTFDKVIPQVLEFVKKGHDVHAIVSENVQHTDTRFGKSEDFMKRLENITGNPLITSIREAEPIGPKNFLDCLMIAPCTGNTLSKLANGITDTCVTMAAKATLRNQNPLILAISTNDGLSGSARSLGTVLNYKNVYFVPFRQDEYIKKETSLVAEMTKIYDTFAAAFEGRQLQPLLLEGKTAQAK